MIAFLTQYYHGLGHAMRIKYISDCLPKDSFIVINQLMNPPIKYNTQFSYYCEKTPENEETNLFSFFMKSEKARKRVSKVLEILNNHPNITKLVCEGFPFCRQQFSYEYFKIFDECKKRNISIIISIRDYPWDTPHNKSLLDWVAKTINLVILNYNCKILIHGDEAYLPLISDLTHNYYWSELLTDIKNRIFYTGYVCNSELSIHKKENNKVYISCGLNKKEGLYIYKTILKSLAPRFPNLEFNVVLGSNFLHDKLGGDRNNKNVIVTNYIPNLSKKLENCTAYITYGGYNSTTDIIKAKIPSIIIPRQTEDKLEQVIRAYKFEELNIFKVCSILNLSRIHEVLKIILEEKTFPNSHNINLNGALNSVELLKSF